MGYVCDHEGCRKGIATGHALHRVSPKGPGQQFVGLCSEHFAGIPGMKYPDRVYGGKPLFRIPLSRWQPMRTDDDTPGQKVRL